MTGVQTCALPIFALQEVSINPKILRHYHLPNKKGLFVIGIEPDSPASRSQVKEGDIIVSFNSKPMNSTQDLFKELTKPRIVSMTDISIIRHTELMNVNVVPVDR